jgi:hypothetical protein
MHTFTVAFAIGTAVVLAACGTQDGGGRAQPTPPAAGVPAGSAGPAADPVGADHPSSPPLAPPAAPAPTAPGAHQPQTLPAAPSASTAPASPPPAPPTLPAAPTASPPPAASAAERDLAISREVRAGLTRDGHLARDSRDVQVSTSAGVVTLTGTVSSDADRRAIRSQAERVSGVVRVEDQLVVR